MKPATVLLPTDQVTRLDITFKYHYKDVQADEVWKSTEFYQKKQVSV